MKAFSHLVLACSLSLVTGASVAAQEEALPRRSQPWPAEVVDLAEHLAIQDGGRIKPLDTYAGFTMLRLNGKRRLRFESGETLSPVEWLLDVLFFPDQAADYPVFVVDNIAAVEAAGIPTTGKEKRDRYSFRELSPGIQRLFELAHEYGSIEQKERTNVQQQVYVLASNVNSYIQITGHMDFGRIQLPVPPGDGLREIFGDRREVPFHEALGATTQLWRLYEKLSDEDAFGGAQELSGLTALLKGMSELAGRTEAVALLPPTSSDVEAEPEWLTPSDLFSRGLDGEPLAQEHLAMLASLEGMIAAGDDLQAFKGSLTRFHELNSELAGRRGEYGAIGMEVKYYDFDLIYRGLLLFVLAFLLVAFMWLRPRSTWLYVCGWAACSLGTLLLVGAIVMRCVIRSRPPITGLYDTLIFVTAVGVLVALFLEKVNRQRLALSAAAILGTVGLFASIRYEVLDKQDTMPSLVAVLDTNFWLATHVTTINMGYAAGMLAALMSSLYLIAKTFRLKRQDRGFYRSLARMSYGVLCFGVLFSLVGTILGGIWANDSWGRFWGWDPKENGALLIVISQVAILHARMGGYLKEFGLSMAMAASGTIVAFSWFGVNLLGVGLHSYGFTSGIHAALWTYYGIQGGIVLLGGLSWVIERSALAQAKEMAAAKEQAAQAAPEAS